MIAYVFILPVKGPERGRLEYLRDLLGLQEKVFFLGEYRKNGSFLAGLDIFVLASRSEGLSIALLEAGCAGLPLIASATGGIPEIVRDGETGILVPSEDELSLAEAIIFLIEDPKKRKNLGDEAAGISESGLMKIICLKKRKRFTMKYLRKGRVILPALENQSEQLSGFFNEKRILKAAVLLISAVLFFCCIFSAAFANELTGGGKF
jgi:glycosyltransferase involved in cell wall biosynthesis